MRYIDVSNNIEEQIRNDLKDIESKSKIFKTDKSINLYNMSPTRYMHMLNNEVF